ncbi:MAG: nucleotide sugar dehydrogenase [Magnetococcales bacterium]|nr:nucleotide sugar dehydrogenase [Magnetococcales bacterium]
MYDTIAVMGMGYVGMTLAVILAEIGYNVYGIEINSSVVTQLRQGNPHFFEENLDVRLRHQLARKTLHIESGVPDIPIDIFVISVGTPLLPGQHIPNLDHIQEVVKDVGKHLKKGAMVLIRSTVPMGLSRNIVLPLLERISGLKGGEDFYLAFTPERTIEGKALTELRNNPQVVGGLTTGCTEKAAIFFQRMTPAVIHLSSLEAAEMCKLIDNTYRDVRFAYANEMAQAAEALGLDIHEIIWAANIHYPRNSIPVPSPGVGGACLSKDPYILMDTTSRHGYPLQLIAKAREINEGYPGLIVRRIQTEMVRLGSDLNHAKVLVIGFAFKGDPETADLRDSTTLWLLRELKAYAPQCRIQGYDAVVMDSEISALGVEPVALPQGFDGVNVVIIANNHPSYRKWDLLDMAERLARPALVYDGWRILDRDSVMTLDGVGYMGVGI